MNNEYNKLLFIKVQELGIIGIYIKYSWLRVLAGSENADRALCLAVWRTKYIHSEGDTIKTLKHKYLVTEENRVN